LLLIGSLVLGGCLSDVTGQAGGGDGNGAGNGAAGGNGAGGIDPQCGKMTFPISTSKTSPNVMLVVDESGSMKEPVPGTTLTKWDSLKMAVETLLSKYSGQVSWGLSVFPKIGAADECAPGVVDVPVAANQQTAILTVLNGLTNDTIGGSTPTASSLQAVLDSNTLKDATHNNYVLLMTDGQPNCGGNGKDVTNKVKALYAAAPSVRTFVVGLGDGTQSDPQTLNDWATAGHTARMGSPLYYQANNVTDLDMAFAEIANGIASCEYKLAKKPDDASLLQTYIDGKIVAIDPNNGVTYDAASGSIIFHGAACDAVKTGGTTAVDVIYGCPSPVIG
jgi:hypothetical protein